MVNSGLTLVRALTVLQEQTRNPTFAGVIADVRARVEQGSSLSASLANHPRVFPWTEKLLRGASRLLPGRWREPVVTFALHFVRALRLDLGWKGIAAVAGGLPGRVINLAGELTLRQTIVIMARCRLFIGNDSGLTHIAAALAVPLVAIFGPTEPGKTAPLGRDRRLLHHGADCAPCLHRVCPTDHRCMSSVSVGAVLAAAAELWERESPGSK